MISQMNRRGFLRIAGASSVLAGLGAGPGVVAQEAGKDVIEIKIDTLYRIGRWHFDPVGLHVRPGQKVRWVCLKWGGSATAFHPLHDNHELRIPEGAKAFDSGILIDGGLRGSTFEWVFEQEGTYDYYSRHHERLGAVGRIIVGTPGGPAEKPPGYGGSEGRAVMFGDSRKIFAWLTPERILKEKSVPFPAEMMERTFPYLESHF